MITHPPHPRNTTRYVVPGTDTFRLASKMLTVRITTPARDGQVGSNLQNIDKHSRAIYIPDKGKVFVQRDQSGAEAKIVAYCAKDGKFRRLFENNIKPHVYVALHLFADKWQKEVNSSAFGGQDTKCDIQELVHCSIPELPRHPHWKAINKMIKASDNWPAEKRYYFMAKTTCHSANYDGGAGTLVMSALKNSRGRVILSKREGEGFLGFYHSEFGEIRDWHRGTEKQILDTSYMYNLFGYPKVVFHTGNLEPKRLRECIAWVPQSTVGCITRNAYIRMYKFIQDTGVDWDLLADTHDSYMVQCPEAEAEQCNAVMKEFLEQLLIAPSDGTQFQMLSEGMIGKNWSPYKKDSNPLGLQETN
jgi:DNA polymerase I-like protein with 3'-5' exonuclease and polymerase domains